MAGATKGKGKGESGERTREREKEASFPLSLAPLACHAQARFPFSLVPLLKPLFSVVNIKCNFIIKIIMIYIVILGLIQLSTTC